jgi:hypothetical protein
LFLNLERRGNPRVEDARLRRPGLHCLYALTNLADRVFSIRVERLS